MAQNEGDKIKKIRSNIGGQAVIEGVMMKGERSLATAVRNEQGQIVVESKYTKSIKEKNVLFRIPFLRGVLNLVTQLYEGTGILLKSAEVYGEELEMSKFEKAMSDKFKIKPLDAVMGFSVVLGLLLAIGLFVFLPNLITGAIFEIDALKATHPALQSLVEGCIMLTIFVLYILSVSMLKDVKRVFMYHGAEHKVITCFENGLDLTVENAKKQSKAHSRCGTTFMFIVVTVSILVFALINWLLSELGWLSDSNVVNALIKLGVKILFLPVVAGVSYELLKLFAKSDNILFKVLRSPGMMLQKLTTKEPTDDMLEVSIMAFKTVYDMDRNPDLDEQKFDDFVCYKTHRTKIEKIASSADTSDIDWLYVSVLGVNRSALGSLQFVSKQDSAKIEDYAQKMSGGLPLQYALGYEMFCDTKIVLNRDVLIPRPETEELVLLADSEIKSRKARKVLDLCTGSGAIAVVLKKLNPDTEIGACDISESALRVAKVNADKNDVAVEFLQGDMLDAVKGIKFDVIVSNPPYIKSGDIKNLDTKVKDFEPMLALDGGLDGLGAYHKIAECASKNLTKRGCLLLEFGFDQAEEIKNIFSEFSVEIIKDINGKDRIAKIEKVANES